MARWRVKKIVVIAHDIDGKGEQTLELEKKDLDRYTGLFWNPNYSHLQMLYTHQNKSMPSVLAIAPGIGNEAIMLKDPNCELTPWPT
jgi:hypothetical protein